jgi:hypothetical protein
MSCWQAYLCSVQGDVFAAREKDGDVLVVSGIAQPMDHEAAAFLRDKFPFTAPQRVLHHPRTFGVGDRLGIATPGHLRVFERFDAVPVLAQQSMRELKLTGRSYTDVLDSVTLAVFKAGYTLGFGADGDHLKQAEEVHSALNLGYTMITLDCSEHIRGPEGRAELTQALKDRYLGRRFDLDEGPALTFSEDSLAQAQFFYGGALDFVAEIWRSSFESKAQADLEISIDETALPTSPLQHFFAASELRHRGVRMATMAPRFVGEFQKGIDYIGDVSAFDREMQTHAAIARHFGYKISVHSGSDKFSVFPFIARHTRGVFHVKTAGTNWLEAMRTVAERDPALYRQAHVFALKSFPAARAFYHVSARAENVPPLSSLRDEELPGLYDQDDARQLIHITYGLILGNPALRKALYALWDKEAEAYSARLEHHIGRHLLALNVGERG